MWNPMQIRKTVSIPPSPTQTPIDAKPQRKTVHAVHKANTISIPSEAEIASASDGKNHSPSKTKMLFSGRFRNTMRSKSKIEHSYPESSKEDEKNDNQRRWSEANHTVMIVIENISMAF